MTGLEKITKSNLIDQFRRAFPELEPGYEEQRLNCPENYQPSNYDVMGCVLQPRLKVALEKSTESEFLVRCAGFLERVCTSGDIEALNVIWIELFEWLIMRPDELKVLWPFLGGSTKAAIKDAAVRWGKTRNLPGQSLL
jgi:hypothetical protein